jgi:hypothetical protein
LFHPKAVWEESQEQNPHAPKKEPGAWGSSWQHDKRFGGRHVPV